MDLKEHWNSIYRNKDLKQVSWHQDMPSLSLALISMVTMDRNARILDVGAGTSTLVDNLLDIGYRNLGILDISETAIEITKERLGDKAQKIEWFLSEVTKFQPPHLWDIWHDRAVFHFLTEDYERKAYIECMESSLAEDATAVIGTFGPEGPTQCSGLNCKCYGVDDMTEWVGSAFSLEHYQTVEHKTPRNVIQQFMFFLLKRTGKAIGSAR